MSTDSNTISGGLSYRSMVDPAADSVLVNVYRDINHLPSQEDSIAYRFPSPPKKQFSFVTNRVDKLRSKV